MKNLMILGLCVAGWMLIPAGAYASGCNRYDAIGYDEISIIVGDPFGLGGSVTIRIQGHSYPGVPSAALGSTSHDGLDGNEITDVIKQDAFDKVSLIICREAIAFNQNQDMLGYLYSAAYISNSKHFSAGFFKRSTAIEIETVLRNSKGQDAESKS